jgi:uncharacterized protein (TIGR03435 family)
MHAKWKLVAVLIAGCAALRGQAVPTSTQTAPASPQFEVVSIKRSTSLDTKKSLRMTPDGGFLAFNYSLRNLIAYGWDMRNILVLGGPGWLDSERYDVEAKTTVPLNVHSPAGNRQFHSMVQSFLADRFQVRAHRQMRQMKVYFLEVARNGPRVKRTGDVMDADTSMHDSNGHFAATKIDMAILAGNLGAEVGVVALNRTGLTGVYDIRLDWAVDDGSSDAASPSIFTAIEEQLGLHLRPGKALVDVIVVDRAQRPSDN